MNLFKYLMTKIRLRRYQKSKWTIKELRGGKWLMAYTDNGYTLFLKNKIMFAMVPVPIPDKKILFGETQVTQEVWCAVMGNNPSYNKNLKCPVENVSHSRCIEFINKLNELTGLSFRLPNAGEWWFAAKYSYSTNKKRYIGSDDPNETAWFDRNSGDHTHPVKQKLPNELGLYDMGGNVFEWTSTKGTRIKTINFDNGYIRPKMEIEETNNYIILGGSYHLSERYFDLSQQHDQAKLARNHYIGLRIVLESKENDINSQKNS